MQILVTGGTGFIGRRLCTRLLAEGHDPIVLTRRPGRRVSTMGSWPSANRRVHRRLPMKPVPPVTRICMVGAPLKSRTV